MKIAVLKEDLPGEARVALMPDSVKKLLGLKASVLVESGAGLAAARSDSEYVEAGAEVSADRTAILAATDVLVTVNRPSDEVIAALGKGAVVLGFQRPLDEPAQLTPALERGLTTFAMELVPRITRAQSMDALSSMATVVDDGRRYCSARACVGVGRRRGRLAGDCHGAAPWRSRRSLRRSRCRWRTSAIARRNVFGSGFGRTQN